MLMATTYKLIAKQTLSSAASTIDFTNIPGTYSDLYLVTSLRGTRSGIVDYVRLRFNGAVDDTNHFFRQLYGNGVPTTGSGTNADIRIGAIPAGTATANTFNSSETYIPNYTASTNKSMSITNVRPDNSSSFEVEAAAGLWSNTSAITSISIQGVLSTLASGSTAYLYGITRADNVPGTFGIQATGGDEVFIANGYKVHVFKSSGTFNVTSPGFVEYLVIGGGGSGGPTSGTGIGGAGGGAGGYRSSVPGQSSGGGAGSESQNLMSAGSYNILVGAGGAGTTTTSTGTTGNNSQIMSVISNGGGHGAGTWTATFAGGVGGSGGGGYPTISGGAGISGQGYSGGTGGGGTPNQNGGPGGGGGAGSVGGTGGLEQNGGHGGNGGSGVSSTITGTAVTRAGGGAGGGSLTTGNAGTAGSGGGGRDGDVINGAANTGSGGGGATARLPSYASSKLGGNGGSGVVIIRYPVS